jgi:hypothetical protein
MKGKRRTSRVAFLAFLPHLFYHRITLFQRGSPFYTSLKIIID